MNNKKIRPSSSLSILSVIITLAFAFAGCDISTTSNSNTSSNTGTASGAKSDSLLESAKFAKRLAENQEPIDPTDEFQGTDTVCLSLQFKGRPKGKVTTKFYFRDDLINEATIDMADINSGVIFSVGQSTFAGFTLKPDNALPIGNVYRAESFLDGQPIGTFKFKVVPPEGSFPSKISNLTLAHGIDEDKKPVEPGTEFAPGDKVFLVGEGDFGLNTWVEVNWYVDGKLDQEGTRSISLQENKAATPFFFSFLPARGWKPGKHEVVLIMNGSEAGRLSFTTSS